MIPKLGTHVKITQDAWKYSPFSSIVSKLGYRRTHLVCGVRSMGNETEITLVAIENLSAPRNCVYICSSTGAEIIRGVPGKYVLFQTVHSTGYSAYAANHNQNPCKEISLGNDILPRIVGRSIAKESLKRLNSSEEAQECAKCSGPLKEPWPGLKHCPKCEP